MNTNLSLVIQAGGQSSRMGTDKGLITLHGKTLVEWIISQTDSLGAEQLIISNSPELYQDYHLPVYQDVFQGIGALGGLYSALYFASYEWVFVLACDMPFINLQLLGYMQGLANDFDVLIPRLQDPNATEPFRALYRKNCMISVEKAIHSGQRRVISFFPDVRVRYIEWEEILRFDPHGYSFYNINTPDDLGEAERLAALLFQ